MKEVQTKKAGVFLNILLVLLLLIVVALSAYFIYLNIPGSPQSSNSVFEKGQFQTANLSSSIGQFYPNMKFNHNQISYKIDSTCDADKKGRVLEAFSELSNQVGLISFYESETPDIEVSCSETEKLSIEQKYFIAGEGGAKEIIQTGRYNVITNGIILLYGNLGAVQCDWPNVELHELLHVFGFDHSKDKNSLMYPYLESCDQKLDQSIINDLKELYSQQNLADLYFDNISAIKKGRYLDFNVTIKNSGDIDANGVKIAVFDQGEKVEDFPLKDIGFGAGVTFQVTNLKLINRNSNDIEIKIDPDNTISEIDKSNNVAKLTFS